MKKAEAEALISAVNKIMNPRLKRGFRRLDRTELYTPITPEESKMLATFRDVEFNTEFIFFEHTLKLSGLFSFSFIHTDEQDYVRCYMPHELYQFVKGIMDMGYKRFKIPEEARTKEI